MTDDNPINWYIEILKHVKMLILKTVPRDPYCFYVRQGNICGERGLESLR